MTQFERDEAMMSLIHHNMQLGKMVTLVGQLFENVPAEVSARLYPIWAEAYRSALQDLQNAYNLGVTEQRAKYKYTEEDVINAYRNGVQSRYSRTGEAVLEHTFIQSLRDKIQGGDQ